MWSVAGFTVSISVGRFTPYTTRTAAAILITCVHLSAYLFLIFWERQPSFVGVFVTATTFGLSTTFWIVTPLSEYILKKTICVIIGVIVSNCQ